MRPWRDMRLTTTDNDSMVTPLFLMGVPKSGTTLLQRILASHPAISSASEPWILLPPLYALNPAGGVSEYGWRSCQSALTRLCTTLPDGRAGYMRAVGSMARQLYGDLSADGARYFLDKTPRYHLIADELVQALPDARFIFLWRNPVSLMASIILHNGDKLRGLRFGEFDLIRGTSSLAKAEAALGGQALSLRYEDLVRKPEAEVARVMRFLELEFLPSQLSDFASTVFTGGDRNGLERKRIETASLDRWTTVLGSPVRRAYALRLLRRLNSDIMRQYGYDSSALQARLVALQTRWGVKAVTEFAELAAASVFVQLQGQASTALYP